jgi:topoisomerase-4 subunit A
MPTKGIPDMSYIEPLMRQNFLEYASYVIVDRAIPDLRDGCKPVQRRLLHTLFEVDDGRFHKVANIIGETMKLHPHGDASIGDALVVLANKEYFIEKQGNFGNILTGHSAAAPRYIECRLTPLARETLFFKKLTTWRPSYDGRQDEPVFLPSKLPVLLMLGIEGIAVGMATKILPHNFCELLQAQIDLLKKEPIVLLPDFLQGGLLDTEEYEDGRGKVRVRARIDIAPDRKTLTIREVPYSTTTEGLIQSIEAAAQKGKLKVATIEDRTAEEVEIVIHLPRGVYADEVEPRLYAHTQCEVPITSNIVVIRDNHPAEMVVSEILKELTDRLREQIKAELELELAELEDQQHWLTLEQIFIENRVYKRIETARSAKQVRVEVWEGMAVYTEFFIRPMVEEDVERLLKIPIRRISLYDIERFRKEIDNIIRALRKCRGKLRRLTQTTIQYLEALLKKYGPFYPRRTEITSFDMVNKQEVSHQDLKLSYDPKTGFFGSEVHGDQYQIMASEYDKILIVTTDGAYRIVTPPEKVLIPAKPFTIQLFNRDEGVVLTYVYRDPEKIAWVKKIHITGFIHDKEYELMKGKKGKVERLWVGESTHIVHMTFVPMKRQRNKEDWYNLEHAELCGLASRGTKMALKPVQWIKFHKA